MSDGFLDAAACIIYHLYQASFEPHACLVWDKLQYSAHVVMEKCEHLIWDTSTAFETE